ncbi:MAG: amidohydrolase [Actinomycetota bacterium]|nr:amidohydrolase [Actinomycetota bacterium]
MRKLIVADAVVTGAGVRGDSILIEDGRVAAIGRRSDLCAPGLFEERFSGATIIPGFRDAHLHPVPYAAHLDGCSLKAATDIEDVKRMLAEHAGRLLDGHPVVATRLDDECLAERRLPTRVDLDEAVRSRPVVVYRYCGHVAVANTAALDACGVTNRTPDPPGGTIDRDSAGHPTGVLRETATALIAEALSGSEMLSEDQLISSLTGLAGVGITSIGAMIGCGERPFEQLETELELWCAIADRLPIKVHALVVADTALRLEDSVRAIAKADRRFQWLGVKRFADGSLGGHTAAMHTPFADADTTGTFRLTDADVTVCARSIELGGMAAIHAIGDRAVDGALDLFDDLISNGADPANLRMEHVSVIRPSQIERFRATGVAAVVQPSFLASEFKWLASRVGEERLAWVYPFRSLLKAGVPTAGSSDSPVEPPQPLWGMAAAMDRFGVNPGERLSGLEALSLFTVGAATALREPAPLSPGAPADIVVIDCDPSIATAHEIRDSHVLDTFVDGHSVPVDRSLPVWTA